MECGERERIDEGEDKKGRSKLEEARGEIMEKIQSER